MAHPSNITMYSWAYLHTVIMDGNMSAQHVHSRVPGNDIDFAKGTGFMVASDLFESYLEHAVEDKAIRTLPLCSLCFVYIVLGMGRASYMSQQSGNGASWQKQSQKS